MAKLSFKTDFSCNQRFLFTQPEGDLSGHVPALPQSLTPGSRLTGICRSEITLLFNVLNRQILAKTAPRVGSYRLRIGPGRIDWYVNPRVRIQRLIEPIRQPVAMYM